MLGKPVRMHQLTNGLNHFIQYCKIFFEIAYPLSL